MGASRTDITMQDVLAGAFQALLPWGYGGAELCAQAEKAFRGRESVPLDEPISLDLAQSEQLPE